MTVRYYLSSDSGAPTLAYNVAGSLIAVLDACLVNGYGSRTAAGWTKPYSGTNLAVYRQGGGPMRYLNVVDTSTASNGPVIVRAYESMTGTGTGTNPFPTVAQVASPTWYRGYLTNVITWAVVADETAFYLYVLAGTNAGLYFFGEPNTLDTSDAYATVLNFPTTTLNNVANNSIGAGFSISSTAAIPGHYSCRSYDAATKSFGLSKHTDVWKTGASTFMGAGVLNYPNITDGGIYMAPIWFTEVNTLNYIRSTAPGLWCPLTSMTTFNHLDIVTPTTGDLAGRALLVLKPITSTVGSAFIEISDTWR